MLQTYKNGQGSIVLRMKVLDSSSSTGAGLTGVASNAAGMIISTIADVESTPTLYGATASVETITTLGTFSAPTATRCRWREVDSTNHKGVYELQLADARFAVSNAKSVLVSVAGATNMAQADFVVQLQSDDPFVAKPANFAVTSIDASGRVDIGKIVGAAVDTTLPQIGTRLVNIGASAVDTTASQLGVRVNNAAGVAWASGAITSGVFAAGAIDSAAYSTTGIARIQAGLATPTNITAGTITTVTNVTNVSAGGISSASIASSAVDSSAFTASAITRIQAGLATPTNITAATGIDVTKVLGAAVDTTLAQLGVRVVNIGAAAVSSAVAQIGTRVVVIDADPVTSVADGLLNRDMATGTDSGSTTVRTPRQALRFLRNKWDIAGGVLTVTKENDTTASWTASVSTDSTAVQIIGTDPAGP